MKRFFEYVKAIPVKQKIKYCTMLASFVIFLIFMGIGSYFKNLLPDVNAYKKWDKKEEFTQMAVYLPLGVMPDSGMYDGMMFSMQEKLQNEGYKPENENARMMIGAYSGYGSITFTTDKTTASVDAIGVGGDFFYFHPIDLIDGSYLYSESLMQDYVILDKNTAWKLFGAINVTGMTVMIGDTPFLVAGVYEPTEIYLAKEAGLDNSFVFMHYSAMEQFGSSSGIQWLDFIVPNPVKGYGKKLIDENSVLSVENCVVMDNSTRYQAFSLYKLVPGYLERVMSKTGIVYPYWENIARGYENILVVFLLVETVCLGIGIALLLNIIKPVKNIKRAINWLVTKIKGGKSYEKNV